MIFSADADANLKSLPPYFHGVPEARAYAAAVARVEAEFAKGLSADVDKCHQLNAAMSLAWDRFHACWPRGGELHRAFLLALAPRFLFMASMVVGAFAAPVPWSWGFVAAEGLLFFGVEKVFDKAMVRATEKKARRLRAAAADEAAKKLEGVCTPE